MRNIFWVVGAALVFSNVTAVAQIFIQCRAFEFAEMQSMSKEELTELYCNNNGKIYSTRKHEDIVKESIRKYKELLPQHQKIGDKRGLESTLNLIKEREDVLNKYFEYIYACSEENSRIVRLIKKDDAKFEPPKCWQ